MAADSTPYTKQTLTNIEGMVGAHLKALADKMDIPFEEKIFKKMVKCRSENDRLTVSFQFPEGLAPEIRPVLSKVLDMFFIAEIGPAVSKINQREMVTIKNDLFASEISGAEEVVFEQLLKGVLFGNNDWRAKVGLNSFDSVLKPEGRAA